MSWLTTIPGGPLRPPPEGFALPHGTGQAWEAVSVAMREDAEMKLPRIGSRERMMHDLGIDATEYERRMAQAERDYEGYKGVKEGK